jgi:DNA-binding NtrC family response regulator
MLARGEETTVDLQKILVIDDEPTIRFAIINYLEARGFEVRAAESGAQAKRVYRGFRPGAVVLDYRLPDSDALGLLDELRAIDATPRFVVLTAHGSIDLAVRAVKKGAEDFLAKPVDLATLEAVLRRMLDQPRWTQGGENGSSCEGPDPLLGESRAIRDFASEVEVALRSSGPILLLGETGTGKGVMARWLHERGARHGQAFVDLNCAGLSRELLESELFGHARGAFTGAVAEKKGLLEVAHRGTLFLDEVGDLDPVVQPKLLKALEERRFRRMGEVLDRRVDLLLIAATNLDLAERVRAGTFRADLYFRINTIPLVVPALRDRRSDIPHLAGRLLAQLGQGITLAPAALEALQEHSWPGNIRELRHVLERAVLRTAGSQLTAADLRLDTVRNGIATVAGGLTLKELGRLQVETVLREERGKVTQAARRLGIPRSTLYQKLREWGLNPAMFQG